MKGTLKPRSITLVFTIILIPLIFVPLNFWVDPICDKVTSSIFFSNICINSISFLANTSSWLILFITVIFAYIVSAIYVNYKSKNKKFGKVTASHIIFATLAFSVTAFILILMGISSLVGFGVTNEAKRFMIPVKSYAHSQGWISVQVIDNPAVIDNTIPTYSEVFLTNKTPYEIASPMLTLIRKEGFLNGSGISSEVIQTTIKDHYDLDLGGIDASGNKISVTISTKEYANEDGSTTKVPPGMTAVIVYTEYDENSN